MDSRDDDRLDRGAFELASLADKPGDRQYWMSKSPAERFEALELFRQTANGYDPATARLQRVFEVAELQLR